jgi:hypothetical protein
MQDRTPQYEHNRESEGEGPSGSTQPHNPAEYNTPATTPSPAAPTTPNTNTPGREINPPPHKYPQPQPMAGKDSNTDAPRSTSNIDDVVTEASEESFPASDPPSSHRSG